LFTRIANGDGTAFTELFRQYFEPLKWNALKMLKSEFWAEEIVQEVFTQLWDNREKLAAVESPAGFLFKITANRCLDRIRRQELEIKMQYVVNKALHRDTNSFQENSYDLDFIEKLIKEAVQQLPEQGRLVFELQRNEGLSYQEIADRLGISRNTVRNHMVKSLHFIRTYLRQKGEIFVLLFCVWYFF
jgi:RNA polymerase sigma-70 factor (family 1)